MNVALEGWLAFWRMKQWWHGYTVDGIERLVDAPASLIVGYHGRPFAYDVCMLTVALYDRLGYLPHGIVHRGVKNIPVVNGFFDGIGFVTGDQDDLAQVVARGEHIVVTPGGANEGCRSYRQSYRVHWGDRVGYLRMALKYRLPIVPVAAAGADEGYIGLNDGPAIGAKLGLPSDWAWLPWVGVGPLGVWPFSPPFPVRMRQLIGEPIDLQADGPVRADDRPALLRLHRQVIDAVQGLLDVARTPARAKASTASVSRPTRSRREEERRRWAK